MITSRLRFAPVAAASGVLLAAVAAPAIAADITMSPPGGGGVVINGPISLPGVPGSTGQSGGVVCYEVSTGLLGPCPASYGATGATGPTGHRPFGTMPR